MRTCAPRRDGSAAVRRHATDAPPPRARQTQPSAPNRTWQLLATAVGRRSSEPRLQAKLKVGPVDDPYERQADRIANEVVEQRDSGGTDPGILTVGSPPGVEVPPGLADRVLALSGGGRSVPDELRGPAETRLGRDFAGVRIHTGGEAGKVASQLGARAFTVGRDVVFAEGEYRPETRAGRGLVAHELVHVAQQASSGGGDTAVAQRAPDDSSLTSVEMTFDGADLIVVDDGSEIARFPATSGRPTAVKEAHAKLCGGTTDENYVNNPRYVAVKDHGAIPEGKYTISPSAIQSFTTAEQVELLDAAARGEKDTKVAGITIHAGDWGRGRVLINPVKVEPGPKPCTKTSLRSGFFLHGGVLRGSAGCIDIGSQFDDLDRLLEGYKKKIPLTVKYPAKPATTMTACELTLGKLFYEGEIGDPLKFITCFTEVKDAADPEAKVIWEELEARFLARQAGGLLKGLTGGE